MSSSTTCVDSVADYIITKLGQTTSMALQKLCVLSQGWHLVWDQEALFTEPIEAWVDGPVVRSLWAKHRGLKNLKSWGKQPGVLTERQRQNIDRVLTLYDGLSAEELSHLMHEQQPWLEARFGLGPKQPGNREITTLALKQFYAAQQQQFNDVFAEFGLNMKLHRGETIMYGRTKDDIEAGIDRLSRAICDRSLPLAKKRVLIQSASRCEYRLQ